MNQERELLKRISTFAKENYPRQMLQLISEIDLVLAKPISEELQKPDSYSKPFTVDWPEYHWQGMGCGIEDRDIIDRYEAARYGWDCAIEAIAELLPERLYKSPQEKRPLSDKEIAKYFFHPIPNLGTAIAFARAIEKAHGIGEV